MTTGVYPRTKSYLRKLKNQGFQKGQSPWNKGKSHLAVRGEKAPWYKGINASYSVKHQWIRRYYGKATKCENELCTYPKINQKQRGKRRILIAPKRYEWANLSGNYKRDITDYIQLCPSCHRKWDLGLFEVKYVSLMREVRT